MLLSFVAAYSVAKWAFTSIILKKNSEIELLERQVRDYQDQLSGKTPEELRERIEELERIVSKLLPKSLSEEQRLAIVKSLKGKSTRIIIMIESSSNELGGLVRQIKTAFESSGWDTSAILIGPIRYPFPASGLRIEHDAKHRAAARKIQRAL